MRNNIDQMDMQQNFLGMQQLITTKIMQHLANPLQQEQKFLCNKSRTQLQKEKKTYATNPQPHRNKNPIATTFEKTCHNKIKHLMQQFEKIVASNS